MAAEHTADAAHAQRINGAELLEHARGLAEAGIGGALLVVALNRSDRLAALALHTSARIALGEIARRVEALLRQDDRYAIAAHDELWLLLPGVADARLASLAARTLHDSLARSIPIALGDATAAPPAQARPVVGGAWTPSALPSDPMVLLRAASEACARASDGDDPVLVLPMAEAGAVEARHRIETELRVALHAGELDVFFQPQVDLGRGRCVGAEALVRWTREDGSHVSPALIASVAESSGLVGPLTQFVLNAALRHQSTWAARGADAGVSINVSPVVLSDPAWPQLVRQALASWSVDPAKLTLEITERLIIRNETAAQRFMDAADALGCRLSLDDFGTGHSSFSYLQRFPLDELKVDHAFVAALSAPDADTRIVRSLVDLAHAFGLSALAVGVEDARAAGSVRALGCDAAQGFHFARPLPPYEFPGWCEAFNAASGPAPAPVAR